MKTFLLPLLPLLHFWQGIGQLFAALVVGMARNPSMKEDLFTCAGAHFRSDTCIYHL